MSASGGQKKHNFGQILTFGAPVPTPFYRWGPYPYRCTDGGEIWRGGLQPGGDLRKFGPLLHAKFHPHRCNVSPLRGEEPQNRHLSNLNIMRFALRAMLPVKIKYASFVAV